MSSNLATKEEEWRVSIRKAQNGDKTTRDVLITENVGLIYMVLKRFANRGTEMEDLFQIGVIGLIKAIDKFDTSRDLSFSTYAVPMIIGEIRRFLRDDGMLHVSRQIKDNARKIAAAKEDLRKKCKHDPTIQDLMEATGLSSEEILAAIEASSEVESIYQPIGYSSEGGQLVIADQLEDTKKNEQELINRITVEQMLNSLTEQERKLIELRYMEGKTQTESAKVLGMNQVAVSRMEKKILLRLRQQF
ncbi:MAG: SigB/SigF/SigG family RNA polymerase sigma factor [Agathobacter sp.]|nr:SigB/SigF/SigG family RNA polymerase sigma factor [Agathobacter sp.]